MAREGSGSVTQRSYGYARVSSADQNLDRQLDAFSSLDLDAVYEDKASGKDFERPGWRRLKRRLRPGDVLYVLSIDRLGRNYDEILDVWRELTRERGVDVVVLDMPLLDTRKTVDGVTGSFISDIVLQLLAYVAQLEREKIHERQAQGIAAARARGKHLGRPPIERPDVFPQVKDDFDSGRLTRREAAAALDVSPSTFDTWRKSAEPAMACRG